MLLLDRWTRTARGCEKVDAELRTRGRQCRCWIAGWGRRKAVKSILDRLLAGGEQSQFRCWIRGQRRRQAVKAMLERLLADAVDPQYLLPARSPSCCFCNAIAAACFCSRWSAAVVASYDASFDTQPLLPVLTSLLLGSNYHWSNCLEINKWNPFRFVVLINIRVNKPMMSQSLLLGWN